LTNTEEHSFKRELGVPSVPRASAAFPQSITFNVDDSAIDRYGRIQKEKEQRLINFERLMRALFCCQHREEIWKTQTRRSISLCQRALVFTSLIAK